MDSPTLTPELLAAYQELVAANDAVCDFPQLSPGDQVAAWRRLSEALSNVLGRADTAKILLTVLAERDEARAEVARLTREEAQLTVLRHHHHALAVNPAIPGAFSLLSVLRYSAAAIRHLFDAHDCDTDGWEVWREAGIAAARMAAALEGPMPDEDPDPTPDPDPRDSDGPVDEGGGEAKGGDNDHDGDLLELAAPWESLGGTYALVVPNRILGGWAHVTRTGHRIPTPVMEDDAVARLYWPPTCEGAEDAPRDCLLEVPRE